VLKEDSNQKSWHVSEVNSEGEITILRVKRVQPHFSLKAKIRVIWECQEIGNNEMPSQPELERMTTCEENLETICKECGNAVLLFVITGSGIRQWVLHCQDVNEFTMWINKVFPHSPPFPIELEFEEDKDWNEYREVFAISTMQQAE
jgi:hypothetical protein